MAPTKLGDLNCLKKVIRSFLLALKCSKLMKLISSTYRNYRAIAFNVKKNRKKQVLSTVA